MKLTPKRKNLYKHTFNDRNVEGIDQGPFLCNKKPGNDKARILFEQGAST